MTRCPQPTANGAPRPSPPAHPAARRPRRAAGKPVAVLFLIRSLTTGGAQRQLIELVKNLDRSRVAVTVVTFYDGGALRPELERVEGVRLVSLHKRGRWDVLPFLYRLWSVVRRVKPRIIHGYMGTANELSSLMAWLQGARAVWGVRASDMDLALYGRVPAWGFRVGAWLSRSADLIVVNSTSGMRHHVAQGYEGRRMVVVPNGIDTGRFRPDRAAGRGLRAAWGVGERERLIGLVARLDPMKDHPTLLRAAALLAGERPDVRFVCVGDGPAGYRAGLEALSGELGLGGRLIWAGPCADMVAVYNALDLATSSSAFGEGFSNAVAEGMACGVPCVVTNVGDSAAVVGDCGRTVPPKDPEALRRAWADVLRLPGDDYLDLGGRARERIVTEYGVRRLAGRTESLLLGLLGGTR
jgi:glycosyltransferase involved in cell wall biosynthesis